VAVKCAVHSSQFKNNWAHKCTFSKWNKTLKRLSILPIFIVNENGNIVNSRTSILFTKLLASVFELFIRCGLRFSHTRSCAFAGCDLPSIVQKFRIKAERHNKMDILAINTSGYVRNSKRNITLSTQKKKVLLKYTKVRSDTDLKIIRLNHLNNCFGV